MRACVALALTLAAVGLGACGDEGEETTSGTGSEEAATGAPQATGSVDDAVATLNQAIADQDCEAIVSITYSTIRPSDTGEGVAEDPDQPVQPVECSKKSPAPFLLKDLEGTEFTESEEYGGAAAMSEGTGGKPIQGYDRWAVMWLADRDGEWRNISFYPVDPQFEEDLPEAADPVGVTERMIEAVEAGDCSNAEELFGEGLRFGATPKEACETVAGGSTFVPALKEAGEEITVEEIGRSRDYAFVGIDMGDLYYAVQLATPVIEPNQPVQDEVQVADIIRMTDAPEPPEEQEEQK